MDAITQREQQVLALAPTGRDARATREVLASAGIAATICADMADLCRQLDSGAGAGLLTDESLKPEGSLAALAAALARQPKWSDWPLVLLASGGANSPIAMQALQALQNVLVLDRPVHLPTLVSAVKTALRSRQRQYEIRDHLDERKRAEQSLARLAAIVESSDDAIVSKNLNGIIQTWNAGAERLFGYRAEEVIGRPITLLLPPERIHEEDLILERVRSGQRVTHLETVRVTKDGRQIDVSVTVSPIRSRDGQIIGASKIAHDITDRKRAEEKLRESEQRFRTMAESIPQLAWMAQPDGHIVWYNRRWYEYTGTTPEQMEGWGWQAVHDPDELPRVLERWKAAIAEGKPWEDTFPLRRHDGTMRPHLSRAVPMCDQEGRVMRWFGTNTDITERIETEAALQRAKEAAEAANLAKSRFLANMSHELRTPMNAILGMIDVALPKAIQPTVKDCLQTAKGSADLLLMLLNDLLDSAKIESGNLELESAPFSLRRMLDQITRVLGVRAREKGLSFYCRMPDEIPDAINGDRMRLQQVLLNLAGNAIKFTERGEVEVSVRTLSQEGEACLEFAVRDDGIGIPPASLERLFQPFAQADASMARRFGGTGLGLSISKSLVEMMGGRIWVESEVGKGSTFYFTVRLPLAQELPSDFEAPVAIPAAPHAQLRILLVEDNPANQKLATYILQDRGHLVEIAGDGQEAIHLAQQNRYDVILMDVQMPGMDGLEAAAAIRTRENGGRRVPIIAVTAHAMKGDRDQCLEHGMDGYLSKPIEAGQMIALIEGLARGAAPAARESVAPSEPASPLSSAVFDRKTALKRCAGSQDLLAQMAECFVEEVRNLIPQLRAASEQGDLAKVGRLGHRLKGTIVYLGAEPAEKAAVAVENCQADGSERVKTQEAVRALEHECDLLESALAAYRSTAFTPASAGPRQHRSEGRRQ